jgi:lambda repressor-like predicted transcriptional regulator
MNPEIRAAVDARLKEKGMSRADLARAVGAQPNNVTRALNDTGGRGGSIPPLWAAILEALDLELTAQPRTPGEGEK